MPKSRFERSLFAALLVCGLLLLPLRRGGGPGIAHGAEEAEPPVNVSADRMDYHTDTNIVVFTGNALAVRNDVTLAADEMKVTLEQGEGRTAGSVRRIVAKGNVSFRQSPSDGGRERFATGGRGEYAAEGRIITLTEEPRVWEGRNAITGEKLVFYIDENRFVAMGKVGLTVFPEGPAGEE